MRKISRIKKLLVIVCLLSLLILSSCFKNKTTVFEKGIDITVSKPLEEYFLYKDKLPVLHFDYNGVSALIDADGAACFFSNNDQYELSDKFSAHLSNIDKNNIYVLSEEKQGYDVNTARFGKDKLPLDETLENGDKQENSIEYQIVTWTNDGTRYSYQYRTFVSGGKRYYIYRYSSNIGISLEQSLMVTKVDGKNKLLLIPLPYNTKYEVSGNSLTVKALVEKDTYTQERYSKFGYPTALDGYNEETKILKIKDWYTKFCHGEEDNNGDFVISYCGAMFKVVFGIKDAGNSGNLDGFQLVYLGAD